MYLHKSYLKYKEIFISTNFELFATPATFIGKLLIHILRISTFGLIYTFVYKSSGKAEIEGFSATEAIWSLAFVQMLYQCTRNIFENMKDEIITGRIEMVLNKPYSFVAFKFIESIGQVPFKFVIYLIATIVVLGTFFGFPHFSILQITTFIPIFVTGVVLLTLILEMIALFGFWIENPDPIYWIVSKTSWLVNGTFIPIAILPLTFKAIANVFPLSAPFYVGRIFEMHVISDFYRFFSIQLFWILIFLLLIKILYQSGIKQLSINGG